MTSHGSQNYPLDAAGSTLLEQLRDLPYPTYPFEGHALLRQLFPPSFYSFSLSPWPVLLFSLAYYSLSHLANHLHASPPTDWTKPAPTSASRSNIKHDVAAPSAADSKTGAGGAGGDGGGGKGKGARGHGRAKTLRSAILAHNALLALYSAITFLLMAPPVLDLFLQGWRAAGREGLTLALCSMPTNDAYLGRWAYIFYLSKYYEVVDSLILYLKGKQIGHLQSYHHAGALICMWIAVRYQSQPVWVFCVFNSFVHTFMYSYYFCSAMRWPFPRALKRNLTTMQILQIASGTLLTNVYLLVRVHPARVLSALTATQVSTLLPSRLFAAKHASSSSSIASHSQRLLASWMGSTDTSGFLSSSSSSFPSAAARNAMTLAQYATQRTLLKNPQSCLQSKGAEIALHVNTLYMTPLLMLFAHFFVRNYLTKPTHPHTERRQGNSLAPAPTAAKTSEAGQTTVRAR